MLEPSIRARKVHGTSRTRMPSFAAAIVTSLAWNWFSRSSSACSASGENARKPLAGSVIGVPACLGHQPGEELDAVRAARDRILVAAERARAVDHVGLAGQDRRDELRQLERVVLAVRVDRSDDRRRRARVPTR